jgi:hypothetical protein
LLTLVGSSEKAIDGRYLAMNASSIGIYEGDDTSAIRVYQTGSKKKGYTELHTYPVGIVDHALGLIGSNGLMTLMDMVNPEGTKPADGLVMEWDAFRVSNSRLTNEGQGAWVAFPTAKRSWSVKWADGKSLSLPFPQPIRLDLHRLMCHPLDIGSAFMTTDYMPVEIMMEAAGEGRYNSE